MTYKEESDELIKWYAEENRKISEKMREHPVSGLDHPLEVEVKALHQVWLKKLKELQKKYGIE